VVVACIARALRAARVQFGQGTSDAAQEATWMVAHTLRMPFEALAGQAHRALTSAQVRRLDALVAQRTQARMPLAYLLHEAWLGPLKFYVDRRVIIPRSFIAELLRERLRPWIERPARVRRVLDLCTGSACLAIAAAYAFRQAQIDAIDISSAALAVARRNVDAHGVATRVRLLRSNLFAALGDERYDLILSNPPYVNARSMCALPPEYRHEPGLALAAGSDGLELVRPILAQARRWLRPQAWLVLEIGHNRHVLERAYPRMPFVWPQTSGGGGYVCMVQAASLAP
jgi:ribosomal protein L3 glutamine methyltransferase